MASTSRYTTATAFLEQCSTQDIVSYPVPTHSTPDDDAPPPVLAQPDDHALVSTSFFPQTGRKATGFVLARTVEDAYALELRWVSFSLSSDGQPPQDGMDQDQNGDGASSEPNPFAELDAHPGTLPPVRFVFPARLVPTPSFTLAGEGADRRLEVYAVTDAGYLYVLSFPLDSLFYGADLASDDAPEWSEEFRLESVEGRLPVLMQGVEDGRVIVACEDGHVTCVDFAGPDGVLVETELKSLSSFSIRSLVPSFSTRNLASPTKAAFHTPSSASAPTQLVSLAASTTPSPSDPDFLASFAFGVSRDRKLKVWNLLTGAAQSPVDLSKLVTSSSSALALPSSFDSPQASRTASAGALLSSTPQPFLRTVLGTTSTTHTTYLALFVPPSPSSAAAFVLCGLELDAATGDLSTVRPVAERACPPALAAAGSLVDFGVQRMDLGGEARWTLWTLWDEGGEAELRTIGLSELERERAAGGDGADEAWATVDRGEAAKTAQWTAGFFDAQLRDADASVPETFLRHVAVPGRYPPATLEFALAEYESLVLAEVDAAGLPEPEAFQLEYASPLARAAATVGCTVALEQSQQTGAFLVDEYNKRLKLEWLRFVALLNESRAAALFPTHLALDEERGVVAVVARDAVAVPVVREAVHTLASLSADDLLKQQQQLLQHPEDPSALVDLPSTLTSVANFTLLSDVLPLLHAIRALEARLSHGDLVALESALLERTRMPLQSDVGEAALDLFDQALEGSLSDDALREVTAALAALDSPERAIETLVELLKASQLPVPSSPSTQPASALSSALLTSALQASIAARYALAKGLATLLVAVWAAEDDDAVSADVLGASDASAAEGAAERLFPPEKLEQLTAQAWAALHGLAAAQWVANETAVPSVEALRAVQDALQPEGGKGGSDDGFVASFGALRMQQPGAKKAAAGEAEVSPVAPAGLLSALLALPDYAPTLRPSAEASLPLALSSALTSLTASLGLFAPSPAAQPALEVEASPAATVLAFRLLQLGLPIQAGEFAATYPRTSGMEYVKGRALLELGQGEEARLALERAASGVYGADIDDEDPTSPSSALALILPPLIASSLAQFYIHLVSLFVPTPFDGAVARFAQLALEALEVEGTKDEPAEKDLWTKLFRSYAATSDFEKAYEAIMAMPYHETQMTCLAHFISVVCSAGTGATALLTRYSFAGLEADLERNLAFRARNSDPLARPNYYKVLYAYHVAKGDYRSAGTVMYQQGRRLGELTARAGGASFRDLATLQCQSYLAAANALALVPKEHAWVAVVSSEEERGSKRRKLAYHIPEDEFDPAVATRPLEVLELADIRREYTVALARLQLADEFSELERTNFHLDPEAVVALFSQTGRFEEAFSAGRVLDVDLSSLFEAVTERCVSLSLHPEGSQDASWVLLSDETSTWPGPLSSKAWRLLELHLTRHDRAPSYAYRRVVLERTLALNRGNKLPVFLTEFLVKHEPSALLRTLVKYDRLDEAFQVGIEVIKASPTPSTPFTTTLPYSLFDQLLAVPAGDSPHLSDDVLKQRQSELRAALEARVQALGKAEERVRREAGR
ncbi:hypothetical protein JCM10207_005297 [Rhodosporidiobolus poonsookiae]